MTREEAIDVLKHNYPSSCYEDLCKAVDMAIKALKQPEIKCIAKVTLTDEQVKEAFEKVKGEILTAQPEIIRCKDCKYSSPNKVYGCRFERFDTWEDSERMYSDDFCSRAERRTDDLE